MENTPPYRHTQVGYTTIALLGTAILLALAIALVETPEWVTIAVAVMLVIVLIHFSSLSVTLVGELIEVRFGPGLIRVKFHLMDIESCAAVKNSPWYGWGIRLLPRGWLYNVSGLDAVELGLKSGRVYRIGTDEPAELAKAINQAIGKTR